MKLFEFIILCSFGIFLLSQLNQFALKVRCHSHQESFQVEKILKQTLANKQNTIDYHACKSNKIHFKVPSKIDFKRARE